MTTILMVGTRKGLWLATSEDRSDWKVTGPHFPMEEVYSVLLDRRGDTPRLLAGCSSGWSTWAGTSRCRLGVTSALF